MSDMTDAVGRADAVPPDLRRKWRDAHLVAFWESPNVDIDTRERETTQIWRWAETRPILLETVKVASPSIVERRVLELVNRKAKLPDDDATTGMLTAALQIMLPGETARPHRHSMNALRFVIEGCGAETLVDGKPCRMDVGDLVTTPAWTWHEHRNNGSEAVIWMDMLDVTLHRVLGIQQFEAGPMRNAAPQYEDRIFSTAAIVPCIDEAARTYSPVFRYPWARALEALANSPALADGSKRVRYVNPMTGGSCMSLMDCYLLEIGKGVTTTPFRSSSSSICTVAEGEGVSEIDGERVEWREKDTFTIPPNAWASHRAGARARIFMLSNRDLYQRLGLLSEESR